MLGQKLEIEAEWPNLHESYRQASHCWQQLLATGRLASVAELAVVERVDRMRIQKILKLAKLTPDACQFKSVRHRLPRSWRPW